MNLELWKFSSGILEEVSKYTFVIVADQYYFLYFANLGNGFEVVPDDRVAGNIEKRLNQSANIGFSEFSALTLGVSKDNGLNLVPLLGPPTRITALTPVCAAAAAPFLTGSLCIFNP